MPKRRHDKSRSGRIGGSLAEKFDQERVPFVYVFNREGKWVKKFSGKFDYAEVERLADLLKK